MLLKVEGLQTAFFLDHEIRRVLNGVDLVLDTGQVLAVVGESGCGKSVLGFSILGQVPAPGQVVGGRIAFDDVDVTDVQIRRKLLGKQIAMIFQDGLASLCPVQTTGFQISEMWQVHRGLDRHAAEQRAIEMLKAVEVNAPERRVLEYPHQLSGGMRQRVLIAMALACEPKLLIADGCTTGLDVTIQAQVLELMKRLKRERSMAILLTTHDLGVVVEMADRVAVMYAGAIVEEGTVQQVLGEPRHPYTQSLLRALPRLGATKGSLYTIPGRPPDPANLPAGCHFAPRCARADGKCHDAYPPIVPMGDGHLSRCWNEANGSR